MRNIYRYAVKTPSKPSGKNKKKMVWHIRPLLKIKFLKNLESNAHLQYVLHIFLQKTPWGKIEDMTYILVLILPY